MHSSHLDTVRGLLRTARSRRQTLAALLAAALAGVDPPGFVDGRSLVPTFAGAGSGRQAFLIEFFAGAERDPEEEVSLLANETAAPPYRAIRTADRLYVDYQNAAQERELYALDADPFQLQSRHADPAFAAELDNLSAWLATLVDCAAAACRHAENAPRREPRPPHRP